MCYGTDVTGKADIRPQTPVVERLGWSAMSHLPIEVVASHGLRLRQVRESDLEDVTASCNDPDIQAFISGIPSPYTRDDAAQWAAGTNASVRAGGGSSFVIADLVSDRLLGTIGLHRRSSESVEVTVGYWVAPWARRRGAATNATRAAVEWAFDHGINRAELTHRLDNEPSMRVAMASGFTNEGVRRAGHRRRDGSFADVAVWSRLAGDPGEPSLPELPDLPRGALSDGAVTLAPLTPADVDDYFALAQLPEVIATTVTLTPPTRERIARRCADARYNWLLGRQAQFTIRDAETGAFAGLIGMSREGITGQAMFGYDITREHRGRGYAPRAVRLLTEWAFDVVGVARLVAGTAPDNLASQRVLEKAGFTREGFERARLPRTDGVDGRVDNVAWAMLPDDPRL